MPFGDCPGELSGGVVRGTPIQYRDRLPWPGEKDGCPLRLSKPSNRDVNQIDKRG